MSNIVDVATESVKLAGEHTVNSNKAPLTLMEKIMKIIKDLRVWIIDNQGFKTKKFIFFALLRNLTYLDW